MEYCCCCLVAKSCLTLATPWSVACQAPLSMEFPRQEYWSELPFPSPGDLPDLGLELASSELAGRFFTAEHQGSPAVENRILEITQSEQQTERQMGK